MGPMLAFSLARAPTKDGCFHKGLLRNFGICDHTRLSSITTTSFPETWFPASSS